MQQLAKLLDLAPLELRCPSEPVPAEENAFSRFREAGELFREVQDEDYEDCDDQLAYDDLYSESPIFEDEKAIERVKKWMEGNQGALDLFNEGIARGRFQVSRKDAIDSSGGKALLAMREFAYFKLARARLFASEEKFPEAVGELLDIFRLGDLVQGGDGFLIHHLVGLGCQGIAARGYRWIASLPDAPQAQVERLLEACSPPWKAREHMAHALRREFIWFLDELSGFPGENDIAGIARELTKDLEETEQEGLQKRIEDFLRGHPRPLDKIGTARIAGAAFARRIESTRAEWMDRGRHFGDDLEEILRPWPAALVPRGFGAILRGDPEPDPISAEALARAKEAVVRVENPAGKLCAWLVISVAGNEAVLRQAYSMEANLEATRAVLALRLYFLKKGAPARALQALADEKILPSVPRDPFDSKPLKYSLEKKLLWTVGPDGVEEREGPALGEYGGRNDCVWPVPSFEGDRAPLGRGASRLSKP